MAKCREEIEADALNLPPCERARLAKALIASPDEDAETERGWAEEVARRLSEIRTGQVELIPPEDVYRDLDRLVTRPGHS